MLHLTHCPICGRDLEATAHRYFTQVTAEVRGKDLVIVTHREPDQPDPEVYCPDHSRDAIVAALPMYRINHMITTASLAAGNGQDAAGILLAMQADRDEIGASQEEFDRARELADRDCLLDD